MLTGTQVVLMSRIAGEEVGGSFDAITAHSMVTGARIGSFSDWHCIADPD